MNKPKPFNVRQIEYLKRTFNCWFNVAEGGKRGSKNVLNTYAFCLNLETHPDRIHLIAGVTQSTARINIAVCDGYGLFNYFEGRYREGKFQDRSCIYLQTKAGEKIILIAGGRKAGDEAYIKGFTIGSAYITEANECHPDFLNEVASRTLSSSKRRIFHDLNPKDEYDVYYTDILAYHEEMQKNDPNYGYNYGHFTIADNMSISNERLREILRTYDKNSVWYKRDILGLRAVAEGIIFKYFAENPEPYLFDEGDYIDDEGNLKQRFSHLIIGVDFGDSGSVYSFTLTGFLKGWKELRALEEGSIEKGDYISATRLCTEFIKFANRCIEKWGHVEFVFCDSANNTLINTLREACNNAGLYLKIAPVRKNEISQRPLAVDVLLCTGRLKINRECKNLRKALSNLKWDEKKPDIPEDENKGNINDFWDSFCYTFITHTAYIELKR